MLDSLIKDEGTQYSYYAVQGFEVDSPMQPLFCLRKNGIVMPIQSYAYFTRSPSYAYTGSETITFCYIDASGQYGRLSSWEMYGYVAPCFCI